MYLAGISVRRVEGITEALWGTRVSPSTVSNLNKKITGPKDNCRSLSCFTFNLYKAHRRPLRDASQIASASAASFFCRFTKGFTYARGTEPNFMTNAGKLTAPSNAKKRRLPSQLYPALRCKELQHTSPPQMLPKDDGASSISSVHFEHCFAKSRPIVLDLVRSTPLRSGDLNAPPWHIDAAAGASTPSLPRRLQWLRSAA